MELREQHVFSGVILERDQKVAVLRRQRAWSQLTARAPRAVIFNKATHFDHGHSEKSAGRTRAERRADESRALTLPFKSLFAAPLTARIDLALPWIHPGRQLQRMHKAHCSQHANSHTSKHTHAHTNTVQNTDTGESVVLSHTYRHACTHTDNEWTPSPS